MPCPASTKLMRTSQSGQWATLVAVTSTLLVPYDKDRVTLVISPPLAQALRLSLRTDAATALGILLTSAMPPLVLTLGDHGALVMGPIYALKTAGGEAITCWDTALGPLE